MDDEIEKMGFTLMISAPDVKIYSNGVNTISIIYDIKNHSFEVCEINKGEIAIDIDTVGEINAKISSNS